MTVRDELLADGLARQVTESLNRPGHDGGDDLSAAARFQELLDALPAAIYTTDAHGRLTRFNRACVRFSGRTPELGSDRWCVTWKLFHPDGRAMAHDECPMAVALKEGRVLRGAQAIAERPDGTRIWFEPYPTPLFDDAGTLIGGINMLVDITDRKEGEQALHASEALYRQTLSLMPAAVYACDSTGRITYYNERAAQLWGRAPRPGDIDERFCGSDQMILPDGTILPHEQCPMALALRDGRSFRDAEVSIRRPDGSLITVLVNIDPIRNERGEVTGAINAFHDVTDIKRAEKALRESEERLKEQAEQLARESRRKDEFLAMLSHELRNPLAPILGATRVLRLQECSGAGSLVQQQARDVIERQVRHLTRLVNDLLEVSRVITGRVRLQMEEVDLRAVMEGALEATRPLLKERSIALTVGTAEGPLLVQGDSVRLQQILVNLLNNAAKYTDERGSVEISLTSAGEDARIVVRDTGIGISPALLPHIFDLFAQGEQSLDRSKGGLGVGLSLVKHLVLLHNGSVEARSDGIGMGSEFRVLLPLRGGSRAVAGAPAVEREDRERHRLRILVVDDNLDACTMLTALLRHEGHSVQEAHDGAKALEFALAWLPDVVLLDIGLPAMDGYQVARRLRAEHFARDMRLVALTGYGQEEDVRAAQEAGFDAHLIKPIDFDELGRLIGEWGARRSGSA